MLACFGYKTRRASWIRQQRAKNSAYNRQFSAFSDQFARIFCIGAISPNLNRWMQTYYRLPMALHWRSAP